MPENLPPRQTAPLTRLGATKRLGPEDDGRDHLILIGSERPTQGRIAPDERQLAEAVAAFREKATPIIELHERIAATLADRMRFLRYINSVFNSARENWPRHLAALRTDLSTMAEGILNEMFLRKDLRRRLAVAVFRFDDAAAEVRQLARLLEEATESPTSEIVKQLEGLNPAKVKGKVYLLTTYDLLFRGDPILNQIFPPRDRNKLPAAVPNSQPGRPLATERPPVPAPRPVQTLPNPPPTRSLQALWERLKPKGTEADPP